MLIGVGGSGKQSLIRLCSFMRKMEMRQIEISKGYAIKDFLDFMKIQMKEAAI
jgi:dynein heavy chain